MKDKRSCDSGIDDSEAQLTQKEEKRVEIPSGKLIEHSIKGKPTFKTTLTKSSRKCSIELPSLNDRRQKSVGLNRIEKAKSRFCPDGHLRFNKTLHY